MCNAWNHPPGCTCGWGGYGHLGKRTAVPYTQRSSADVFLYVPRITSTYESYVNPNARCPVCGEGVWFYQSPNGGRVFFSEFGYPWPKHPCTDSRSTPKPITDYVRSSQPSGKVVYHWQRSGWRPFFISRVERFDVTLIRISGQLEGACLALYAKSLLVRGLPGYEVRSISPSCLAQAKRVEVGKYKFSVITEEGYSDTFFLYDSQDKAMVDSGEREKVLVVSASTSREQDGKNGAEASGMTVMGIAFRKAMSKARDST